MSFLNQLKSQASALQNQQEALAAGSESNTALVEQAARVVWQYLSDLARQLNVIQPAGPTLSLDGRTKWPAVVLQRFAADVRKKTLRNKEVSDTIALAWMILPAPGSPKQGSVSANFPPELNRIESRLAAGTVPHERVSVRHPEKNTLQAVRFDHQIEARGNVTVTCQHDDGRLAFRLANVAGLEVVNTVYPAQQVDSGLMDELAKLICGQPSRFG
jgi:hypothetical protein